MNNKIIEFLDNSRNKTLKIVTNKFTLRAFSRLFSHMEDIDKLEIIINDSNLFNLNDSNKEKRLYKIDETTYNLFNDKHELVLKNDLLNPYYAQQFSNLINKKIFIKSNLKNNQKIKLSFLLNSASNDGYILNNTEININSLGEHSQNDIYYLCHYFDIENYSNLLDIFNQCWNSENYEDVSEFYIDKLNSIFRNHSPQYLYYFNLYNIFYDYIYNLKTDQIEGSTTWKNTQIYNKLYDFQKNAVYGIIDKIEKYNGCILSDSVGLGKTYEALAVIKYYELKGLRTLVLCPKKLKHNWDLFINNYELNELNEDKFNYDVLCHTDINRQSGTSGSIDLAHIKWDNYDLVVIDESHNFRNRRWNEYSENKSRYQQLMEKIILSGRQTKVLLLSATPVNNSMIDIHNQILFITSNNDKALIDDGIESIKKICINAEKMSNEWSKLDQESRTPEKFAAMIGNKFIKLMNLISIARSRKQIINNYKDSNLNFPYRREPKSLHTKQVEGVKNNWTIKDINKIISSIQFACYRPFKYLKPSVIDLYNEKFKTQNANNFLQKDRETALAKIMSINWLKRYESSIHSFLLTIKKFKENVEDKLDKILIYKLKQNYSNMEINNESDFDDDYEEELEINKYSIPLKDIDIVSFQEALETDLKNIKIIEDNYQDFTYQHDQKLNELIQVIENKIHNPINDSNKKVLIFSSFSDTAEYIYDYISAYFLEKYNFNTAIITGNVYKSTLENKFNIDEILTYFSPISKGLDKTNYDKNISIDILVATDCISEGQNLQDCDFLINYDIHWNPVRIIQRFGRIDRLSSINQQIQMVNFWPDVELDEYIKLNTIINSKMQKVSHASTGDENILNNLNNEYSYRDEQLKILKEQIIDIEDLKGDISLSNLGFNEFNTDLNLFLDENYKSLVTQQTGIFSICASNSKWKPGIIFLFKNLEYEENIENYISPYYLIYIDNNKDLVLNYNQPLKILETLRAIANDNPNVNKDLCDIFNKETNFGFNMDNYIDILNAAIDKLNFKNLHNHFASLFNKNITHILKDKQFELISFLIIKE